jgi:hypothetical protein
MYIMYNYEFKMLIINFISVFKLSIINIDKIIYNNFIFIKK